MHPTPEDVRAADHYRLNPGEPVTPRVIAFGRRVGGRVIAALRSDLELPEEATLVERAGAAWRVVRWGEA